MDTDQTSTKMISDQFNLFQSDGEVKISSGEMNLRSATRIMREHTRTEKHQIVVTKLKKGMFLNGAQDMIRYA